MTDIKFVRLNGGSKYSYWIVSLYTMRNLQQGHVMKSGSLFTSPFITVVFGHLFNVVVKVKFQYLN